MKEEMENIAKIMTLIDELPVSIDRTRLKLACLILQLKNKAKGVMEHHNDIQSMQLLLLLILDMLLPDMEITINLSHVDKLICWNIELSGEENIKRLLGDRGKLLRSIEYVMQEIAAASGISITLTLNE